jgi:tocopherol cyclase
MAHPLRKLTHPLLFQGSTAKRRYFEGWYFKHVSADGRSVFALIPGISLSPRGSHAFVQVIDGTTGATRWFSYPLSAFGWSRDRFEIQVGENRFSDTSTEVRLVDDAGSIDAHLRYSGLTPVPFSLKCPGVMGRYAYAPFMECYHAIGSLDHRVEGSVTVDGRRFDFSDGRGYIEKDWGTSFPRSWIWAQSNNFEAPGTSFVFSLARIPWLGRSFPGFFCLLLERGRLHRMATYTGARIVAARLAGTEVELDVRDRGGLLSLRAERSHEGVLLAPEQGAMDRRIGESIDARLRVTLTDGSGRALFNGSGSAAGLEVVGDLSALGVLAAGGGIA